MTEPLKRGLRERPRKRNFDSDVKNPISKNEEGQLYPYIKTYTKQFVNPSQQLNQDAKILIKFINTINRNYSEFMHLKMQKQNQTAKSAQNNQNKQGKRDEGVKENGKRGQESSRNGETQQVRKGKQINSNNGNKSYQKINNKGEDFLTKMKGIALASASSMLELQKTLGKNQGMAPLPKKGAQSNGLSKAKMESSSCFVVRGKQKNGMPEKEDKSSNKFQLTEQKIFKRSAYHVAIAYHIFLSQKTKIVTDSNSYDPTYPARKLKEQMNKRPQ